MKAVMSWEGGDQRIVLSMSAALAREHMEVVVCGFGRYCWVDILQRRKREVQISISIYSNFASPVSVWIGSVLFSVVPAEIRLY